MQEEKKGIELLKKVIDIVVKDIKLGKKIAEGGIGAEDLASIPEVIEAVKVILELASESSEVIEEAKDIDLAEAGVLIMAAISGIQEVKA